jgi:hypothetical protein
MIGAIAANRRRPDHPLMWDQFNAYADASVPSVAKSGQAWGLFSNPGQVTGGYFDSTEGTGASYLEGNPGASRIVRIRCRKVRWNTKGGTRTGTGGTAALVTWGNKGIVQMGTGRATSCHVTVGINNVQWWTRTTEGGTLTSIGTSLHTLSMNVDHEIDVKIDHAAHTGTVTIDGTVHNFSHASITAIKGEVFGNVEPFYNADGTDARVEFADVEFYGAPPTGTLEYVNQNDTWSNTASISRSVKIPTVRPGDIIIVGTVSLDSTNDWVQTAGPTLTALAGKNNRAGISSLVYKRVAAGTPGGLSPDSDQTITIKTQVSGSDVSIAGGIHLFIIRGFSSVGTPTTTNQGSGSTTITMPAWTASPTQVPLDLVFIGSSADHGAPGVVLTPPTNLEIVTSALPAATGRRSGLAVGMDFTANRAATNWTNNKTSYAAVWRVPLVL